MPYFIIAWPAALAGAAFAWSSNRTRPWLLPAAALGHLLLTVLAALRPGGPEFGGWLALDPLGRVVLLLVSVLFACCAFFAAGYLRFRSDRDNRVFCACLLLFLSMTTLTIWAHHWGLMWVAMEATTLAGAPLVYFNRNSSSLEATWKYLVISSVGIALALLGTFFLAYASVRQGLPTSLLVEDLLANAPLLSRPWLRAAFALLLIGYGTKMGLAPMHTWKPDAYGEAPGLAGALFSGGMTACAFLLILRALRLLKAAGEGAFAGQLLLWLGLFSVAVAAAFVMRQKDIKRMLAYSSVEHMGILALGAGIGGTALLGALLHLVNNGLAKGVLFLSAGNIHRAFGAKTTDRVRGAVRRLPLSGSLFLAGLFAVACTPPFGPFVSLLLILGGIFEEGWHWVGGALLFLLFLVFMGLGRTVLAASQGAAPDGEETAAPAYRDTLLTGAPILVLMGLVLLLGLHIPDFLQVFLSDALQYMEGGR
ncbi:MAG: hydrogenase [Candidatus Tectomicrobia bacterium]|uniref:Hydrogenase n=1 Tax=Tectimicrobiota bacterium TaxID=2528274 RepID=A0A932HYY3_UNCTE|nr:hydrogenase [Candidatus Tectomicrobia bacterium]